MASILTNTSAMVALQTLKSTNNKMAGIQNQISTGLKVSSAKDNASTWAIASVMRSDVSGLGTVKESLNLGLATVGVALSASEEVVKLLDEVKTKLLGANDLTNEDSRTKIKEAISKITDQIETIVNSASFNGVSLVKGVGDTPEANEIDILSSLVRADDGTVSTENISVTGVMLEDIFSDTGGLRDETVFNIDADGFDLDGALTAVEGFLSTAIEAAAAFGSAQRQIEIQQSFVGKFVDSLNSGIGAMVDADMEEASARLQALQVQQQLGIQALSIANQNPQNILALFR